MDGVIYHGDKILDGVREFVNWMLDNNKKFVFLTNSPERTPHELSMKLERMGLSVTPDHFYTSAMATAEFLHSQAPGCTAYVIGEAALSKALYDQKIYMNDINPDYVVIGETRTYCFEKIEKAIELVNKGALLLHHIRKSVKSLVARINEQGFLHPEVSDKEVKCKHKNDNNNRQNRKNGVARAFIP